MTDIKTQLQAERDALTERSKALAAELEVYESRKPTGDVCLEELASRSKAELERHKHALDDAAYVIGRRLQLIDVTADFEASLQEPAPAK